MRNQCVIVIMAFIAGKEMTTADVCGTLSSFPVQEGQTAYLQYIPDRKYFRQNRKWIHSNMDNHHALVFDSANRKSLSEKYSEVPTDQGYNLTIKYTDILDTGLYGVLCLETPYYVYSNTYMLKVNKAESTITVPYTQTSSANEIESTSHYRTSHRSSTTTVDSAITGIHKANAIPRSSTVEKDNVHVTHFMTSERLYTTAVYSDRRDRDDVTSYKTEDDGEAIKQIPNQSTTQKDKEKISATEEEESVNTEELKLLIPITGSVVGIVVAVAVGTVCVTVRKKKRNEETQLKTPEMESGDKEGSRPDGRFAEEVRGPFGIQEQAQPSSSDARSDVLAQSSEPPEYASVIPKEKRAWEAKQNTNKGNSLICDNTETENQLVYAELDLQPVSNNRPATSRYEATEYVTIDFSRTGTSQAETGLPEQTETTEYVSVDFSKTGTSETDTVLPKQNETTEYVSVDFSKTGTSQAETGLAEQQDTTEHVMVDLSKKAELQTEDQGAAI